jgi:hypothetical protein
MGLAHLMPSFGSWNLREIDIEAVDLYREHKVRESVVRRCAIESGKPRRDARGRVLRPLSPSSINKTIDVLRWILSVAYEYGHISGNPARGRRRRLREPPRRPVYLAWCRFCATHSSLTEATLDTWPPTIPCSPLGLADIETRTTSGFEC